MKKFWEREKKTPVVEYSEVEQGVPPAAEKKAPEKIDLVLNNQEVLRENQQIILDNIQELGRLIVKLATEEPPQQMTTTKIKKAK